MQVWPIMVWPAQLNEVLDMNYLKNIAILATACTIGLGQPAFADKPKSKDDSMLLEEVLKEHDLAIVKDQERQPLCLNKDMYSIVKKFKKIPNKKKEPERSMTGKEIT